MNNLQTPALLMQSVLLIVGTGGERVNAPAPPDSSQNWPSFRGPFARGVMEGAKTPTTWDGNSNKNVKWKTPIAGLGHSSPVIWGNRLFVTSCVGGDAELRVGLYGDIDPVEDNAPHSWRVYSLDKNNGTILWEKIAHQGPPRIKRHTKSSHANSTPVTDGRHVVAFFGSEGLYCYDVDGKLLWTKDLGVLDAGYWRVPQAQWGFGSSPIIYKNTVIVQCDVQKDSFLAAFDLGNGREVWRTPRRDVCTWSTPTIHQGPNRVELIVNGFHHIGGFDPVSGKGLWTMDGGSDIPVPTPFVAHDLIFITSSHRGPRALYALRLGATGDISLKDDETGNQDVAWARFNRGTYMQTPIVYGEYLFTCTDSGVFTGYEARTGRQVFRKRLGGGGTGFTASAVAADGKLYYAGEEGDVYVVQAGPEGRQLAVNSMGEVCMATPAISEGKLYFRTRHHIFCIAE